MERKPRCVMFLCSTGLGYPVIYVPHRVLCELDALKDDSKRQAKNPDVSRSARKAVSYLNSCLAERHPRVKGQTLKNYALMNDLDIQDADDKILLSCLQMKTAQPDKKVVSVCKILEYLKKLHWSFASFRL